MRNLQEQSCSFEDQVAESERKLTRSQIDDFVADSQFNEDIPERWEMLSNEDKLVLLGIGVMLFGVFIVAIVAFCFF